MSAIFEIQKAQFIKLIDQKFVECAEKGMKLDSSIKGSARISFCKP